MRRLWLAIVLVAGAPPVAKAAEQEQPPEVHPAAFCASSDECAERKGRGSVCVEERCQPYQDATDIFIAVGLSEATPGPPVPFKPLLSILPIIGTNPTTGVMVGAAAILGIYLGPPETTTISNVSANIIYTTKNQILSGINSVLMLANNEWQLQGDWRFLVFNQDTFGLGTGHTPVSQGFTLNGYGTTAAIPGAQPMDLNLLRFREIAYKKVWGPLYIGPGFSFDRYYAIVDRSLDLAATPAVVTSHYAYSTVNGFGTGAYTASGVSLDVLWDSRDSTINPYRGSYASLAYQWTPQFLGSSRDASLLIGEYRTYVSLSAAVPRHVLAFWVLGQTTISGTLPYLALPAVGWDARNRTGRGYVQGRFRGTAEVYAEAEWRFPITTNGLLGGVIFANVETFSRPAVSYAGYTESGESLFSYFRPAGGVGLRIMMNRQSRTNITVDLTVADKTVGFYIGAGEAF
jgi:hypothetical protein